MKERDDFHESKRTWYTLLVYLLFFICTISIIYFVLVIKVIKKTKLLNHKTKLLYRNQDKNYIKGLLSGLLSGLLAYLLIRLF